MSMNHDQNEGECLCQDLALKLPVTQVLWGRITIDHLYFIYISNSRYNEIVLYYSTCDVGPVGQNNHILQPPHSAVAAGSLGWGLKMEKFTTLSSFQKIEFYSQCLYVGLLLLFVDLSLYSQCLFVCLLSPELGPADGC